MLEVLEVLEVRKSDFDSIADFNASRHRSNCEVIDFSRLTSLIIVIEQMPKLQLEDSEFRQVSGTILISV
jgi:hypothetical protein